MRCVFLRMVPERLFLAHACVLMMLGSNCFSPTTNSNPEAALAAVTAFWYPPSLPVASSINLHLSSTSVVVSGNSVTTWTDTGPLALDLPMDTGGPTLLGNQLNGLPVVRFPADGSVVGLRRTSGSPFNNTFTFFAVLRPGAGALGGSILSAGNGCFSTPGNLTIYLTAAKQLVLDKMSDGNVFVSTATFPTNVPNSAIIIANNPGATQWFLNGTQDGTVGSDIFTATPTIFVGTGCNTGTGNFDGDIAELIMYSRAITDAERQSLECYAAAKYGVSISHSCP
ncbi:MAG: LamG domain-containing protein [Spirochaetia bacterium]|nr:LamG domain-containing protein [Spirochaetia bacterium]